MSLFFVAICDWQYGADGIPLREVEQKLTFANHGEELPADMRQRLVRMADQNRDGRLTYQEFYNLVCAAGIS